MKSINSNTSVYDTTIRLLILLLIIVWCLFIMYPFLSIILWSLILSLAMLPLHRSFSEKLGGRPKLASFIIVFSILLVIVLPSGLLIGKLFEEMKELKISYENGTLEVPTPNQKVQDWPIIGEKLYGYWNDASENLEDTLVKYNDELLSFGKKLLQGTMNAASGVIQILIAFIIAGILLVVRGAGESIRKFFRKIAGDRGDEFADVTVKTVGNVVKGILGVALILAIIHGIVFLIAGVPYAGIWTLLILILAVLQIPVAIVTLPIIVYLFASIDLMPAIIWTVILVLAGLSDNLLRPVLLGKGAPVPMLVIFIGVIGGFIFSGFIGLFTGAIVLSIGYKLFVGWINSTDQQEMLNGPG